MAWPSVLSPESNFATLDQAHKALTLQLVQQIHYWIECCLLRGLDQAETTCVLQQLGLQPCLTRIVWNQLELQNPQFFSVYSKGSVIKDTLCNPTPYSDADWLWNLRHFLAQMLQCWSIYKCSILFTAGYVVICMPKQIMDKADLQAVWYWTV